LSGAGASHPSTNCSSSSWSISVVEIAVYPFEWELGRFADPAREGGRIFTGQQLVQHGRRRVVQLVVATGPRVQQDYTLIGVDSPDGVG